MKRILSLFFFTMLMIRPALCQRPYLGHEDKKKPSKITLQHISLEFSPLYPFLKDYIKKAESKYPIFKDGFGYVIIKGVSVNNYSRRPVDATKDEEVSAWMNTSIADFTVDLECHPFAWNPMADCWLCSDYPAFYSYVEGKLILLYDEAMREVFVRNRFAILNKKSVKKLRRITEPYLKNSLDENFLFFDPFRIDKPEFRLDAKQRKYLTNHEIYKLASHTLVKSERYTLLRNHTILLRER